MEVFRATFPSKEMTALWNADFRVPEPGDIHAEALISRAPVNILSALSFLISIMTRQLIDHTAAPRGSLNRAIIGRRLSLDYSMDVFVDTVKIKRE